MINIQYIHYMQSKMSEATTNPTNFEKVAEFHRAFGCTLNTTPQVDVFDKDPKLVKLRNSLITEERDELVEASENKNFVEVIDALADILYVVYGSGAAYGIDLDKAFDLVHKSNMTKLCANEDEANETVEWYKKNELRYDSPAYRKSDDGKYWVVYNQSTNKILKSINYKPVDLSVMVKS
jgi:predicted HAD superfamily Cof-like phosphohydrolase